MAKTLTFEFPEPEIAELESILAQMQLANDKMQQEQEEIDTLKQETHIIAEQTRNVLAQLEAAA